MFTHSNRCSSTIKLVACAAAAAVTLPVMVARAQQATAPATHSVAKEVMRKDLIGMPDKEVVISTVEYGPGVSSPPHRHDAQVFVYVLEGKVNMQVKGGPRMTLGPGETFYENPSDIHAVSGNASKTEPAKILAILIKDKGKPGTRPVPPDQAQ
jgi:quercetin dioxygenase-like cupin family protein